MYLVPSRRLKLQQPRDERQYDKMMQYLVVVHEGAQDGCEVEHGQVLAGAHARPHGKGSIVGRAARQYLKLPLQEPLGAELFGVREELGVARARMHVGEDDGALGDVEAVDLGCLRGAARRRSVEWKEES